MTKQAKDDELVVRFMVLFGRLKNWVDERPSVLLTSIDGDEGLKALARSLSDCADELRDAELADRAMFASPCDPQFVAAWSDYRTRYKSAIMALRSIFRTGSISTIVVEGLLDQRRYAN